MQRKICIFSDIHGNGPAFAAGYPLIVEEQADLYVYLGDLCGYWETMTICFFELVPGITN
jgi:predicted phosphodiesterase